MEGFGLSDSTLPESFWIFPSCELRPDQHLIVFASGKNLIEPPIFWETMIDRCDEWRYIVPENDSVGDEFCI